MKIILHLIKPVFLKLELFRQLLWGFGMDVKIKEDYGQFSKI